MFADPEASMTTMEKKGKNQFVMTYIHTCKKISFFPKKKKHHICCFPRANGTSIAFDVALCCRDGSVDGRNGDALPWIGMAYWRSRRQCFFASRRILFLDSESEYVVVCFQLGGLCLCF
jgi:hypothetical protein